MAPSEVASCSLPYVDLMEVALKVDVDTHQGLREGVPRLAEMLAAKGISATFFVAMGPDNSGRAIWRIVRNRGFVSKMWRTKAVSMYGWRTILSGTLLPSRPIASAFPGLLRDLINAGFEVGVHGYDHVRWQDNLDHLGERGISHEIERGLEVYHTLLGVPAHSFAAPGWRTNGVALGILDSKGLAYRSDTRGRQPYRCLVDGQVMLTPEIPTTLPTLDELMGTNGLRTPRYSQILSLAFFRKLAQCPHDSRRNRGYEPVRNFPRPGRPLVGPRRSFPEARRGRKRSVPKRTARLQSRKNHRARTCRLGLGAGPLPFAGLG